MSLKILGKFHELSNLLEIEEKKIVEVVLLGSTTYQRKKEKILHVGVVQIARIKKFRSAGNTPIRIHFKIKIQAS